MQTFMLKQMDVKLESNLVTALSSVNIMYTMQLSDKSDHVYTEFSDGIISDFYFYAYYCEWEQMER